tara:strand:- start:153 stop:302 length:150 start_codon:yes stop_codon:yes gene_type:complete
MGTDTQLNVVEKTGLVQIQEETVQTQPMDTVVAAVVALVKSMTFWISSI